MKAVYIRISTKEQNETLQRVGVEAYLGGQEALWFIDKEGGKSLARPEFQRLQKEIAKGKVQEVIVWKLDRLSRKMQDGVRVLGDWLDHGVRVVSVTEGFDLSGVQGQLIASVLFAVAEMEYNNIRERAAAGIAVAKAQGKYKGRKRGTYKGKPERAKELFAQGLKPTEIAKLMGVTPMSISRYLRSE